MNQNQAKAIYAFRNNGTKAPISVMFEMETTQSNGNVHNRMISRALGNPNKSRLTTLLSYTEEQLDQNDQKPRSTTFERPSATLVFNFGN